MVLEIGVIRSFLPTALAAREDSNTHGTHSLWTENTAAMVFLSIASLGIIAALALQCAGLIYMCTGKGTPRIQRGENTPARHRRLLKSYKMESEHKTEARRE